MTWIKSTIIMLSTNKKANCKIVKSINYENTLSLYKQGEDKHNQWVGQHLYFLSGEEIKEGDYYICPFSSRIMQFIDGKPKPGLLKPIIATTDTSLKINIDTL